MISVEEALARLLAPLAPVPPEQVSVADAVGRVLAEDVAAQAHAAAVRGLGDGRVRGARRRCRAASR